MAKRLGVIDAFQETLEFCWRRLPTLLRIYWAPSLFFFVVFFALFLAIGSQIHDAVAHLPKGADGKPDPQALKAAIEPAAFHLVLTLAPLMLLAEIIFLAMIAVPVTRLAGAGEEPEGIFFIQWSARHTRYALSTVIVVLAPIAVSWGTIAALVGAGQINGVIEALQALFSGEPNEATILAVQQALGSANYIFEGASWIVTVLLLTLPAIAAIENRIGFGTALGMGLRKFFPITAGLVLILLARFAFVIAFAIVLGVAMAIAFTALAAFKTVLVPVAITLIGTVVGILALAAIFAFNVFYYSLWIVFPAVVYRRLSAESA